MKLKKDAETFNLGDTSFRRQALIDDYKVLLSLLQKVNLEYPEWDKEAQEKYLDFLRDLIKDKSYIHLAYMTGILPIKKYGSHSALNMFTEYSMTNPREMTEFFGFTEKEVYELCKQYKRNFEETKVWYDGYRLTRTKERLLQIYSMYNPKSVVDAMISTMDWTEVMESVSASAVR